MTNATITVTRENHLDHMVKVVPFIVCAYAIQCYFISSVEPEVFAIKGLFFLGACLVAMIAGFVAYDLTHVVKIEEESFSVSVSWLNYNKTYQYHEISSVKVSESSQSFATVTVSLANGKKINVFFADDADKIKKFIEEKRSAPPEIKLAA
jgi:hypothetical protein